MNKYSFLKSRDLIALIICEKWDVKDGHLAVEDDDETDDLALGNEL